MSFSLSMRGQRGIVPCLFAASLAACSACQDGSGPEGPKPDTTAPTLLINFPIEGQYDRDGDALADFDIRWSDPGVVDTASLKVRVLNGVNGPLDGANNILPGWRIERLDTAGVIFHETIDNLLHHGENRIEISVRDDAGNLAVDTLDLNLPAGAFVDSIPSGIASNGSSHARGVVVCPDDKRVYATIGRNVVVVDGDSLKLIGAFPHPLVMDQLNVPFCIPGDPILYVTYWGGRFDRTAMRWLPEIKPAFGTFGIDQSSADPNLLYVGEHEGIGIIDRARAARVGSIPLPGDSVADGELFFDLAMLPNDTKLYMTRAIAGGVIVVEPRTGAVISIIDLEPQLATIGRSGEVELSADGSRLYIALLDAVPRGLLEVDTNTDKPLRRLGLADEVPQELALSPSGKRIFVTNQDRTNRPAVNVLVDVESFQVVERFDRPRAPGAIRIDGGVAFHPNGKLVFVGRDMSIDVYLNRE